MKTLSCHVLDTSQGVPAKGILVSLYFSHNDAPSEQQVTNDDGRVRFSVPLSNEGDCTLIFSTHDYCQTHFGEVFFPEINVKFIANEDRHYHIPVLMSPYSYTTYRGS